MATPTMKAVVFDGPYRVSVQDRSRPEVIDNQDVVVKVLKTALCGSELHTYRGVEPSEAGHIMGHEFVGTVTEAGSEVKTLQIGDKVVTPFTVSCGNCFYCLMGQTSRCAKSQLFGSPSLDGGQAEYVRIPLADGTCLKAPNSIPEEFLVLMADIFPTGYYGVKSALSLAPAMDITKSTIVIVGCGPVGMCAIAAALHFKPKHIFAIDSIESRLKLAKQLGAEPLNFEADREGVLKRIREATDGRGADAAVEVVGVSPALRIAFDALRPFGVLSSIGVHNAEIPWSATEAYDKNLRVQMGRCPVRSVFAESLEVLKGKHHLLGFMFDKIMPLTEAQTAYDLFDKRQVQKVIFTP